MHIVLMHVKLKSKDTTFNYTVRKKIISLQILNDYTTSRSSIKYQTVFKKVTSSVRPNTYPVDSV